MLLYVENDWLYADWLGYQSAQAIPDGCEAIINAVIDHQVIQVINDNTHTKGIWDIQWVAHAFLPFAGAAGVKQLAWILSPEPLCANEAMSVIRTTKTSIQIRAFKNYKEAVQWFT